MSSKESSNFINVVIPQEGFADLYIKKALEKNKFLGIMEFIRVTNFKIDTNMFDRLWEESIPSKTSLLQLKSDKGDQVRQYYIDIENLVKVYTEYYTVYFYRSNKSRNDPLYPPQLMKQIYEMLCQVITNQQKHQEINSDLLIKVYKQQDEFIHYLKSRLDIKKSD